MKGSPRSTLLQRLARTLLGLAITALSQTTLPTTTQAQETETAAAESAVAENAVASDDNQLTHEALRSLRDRMYDAYVKRDMETLLKDVADDVVITWQNGERNIGHGEFLDFYQRMLSGDNPIVKDITSQVEVDDLSILYGEDTAIAHGTLQDTFALTDGSQFTLDSKWTATVVKIDDAWKVASFHVSANIFDNPILSVAQTWLVSMTIGGVVAGLIVGLIIGRITKRTS